MPLSRRLRSRLSRHKSKRLPTCPCSCSSVSANPAPVSANNGGSGNTKSGGSSVVGGSNTTSLSGGVGQSVEMVSGGGGGGGGGGGDSGARFQGTTLSFVKHTWSELVARCSQCERERMEHSVGHCGKHRRASGSTMTKRRPGGKAASGENNSATNGRTNHNHHNNNNNNPPKLNGSKSTSSPSPTSALTSSLSSWLKPAVLLKAAILVAIAAVGPVIILKDFGFTGPSFREVSHHDDQSSSSSSSSSSSRSVKGNGGWRLADAETVAKYDSDYCNIERVSVNDLDPARFEREFRYIKPVIVTFPKGADGWTDREQWSLDNLRRSYAEWEVSSGNSVEIVRRGGNGDVTSKFSDFLDDVMQKKEPASGKPQSYLFDREFYYDSELPATFKLPAYFSNDERLQDSIFFLGASGSGVVFHKHADTWNGVVYGRKRWFLYPISRTPPGGVYHGYTILDWYARVYPKLNLKKSPLECVQRGGEIFYLPEGYYHATINIGDTVAVALQTKEPTLVAEKLDYQVTALVKQLEDPGSDTRQINEKLLHNFLKLKEILPQSAEVIMKLGEKYGDLGQHKHAVEYLQKATVLDPWFVLAYSLLGTNLAMLGRDDEAETAFTTAIKLSDGVWDVFKEYGMFLINRQRYADAVPVLKKGTALNPSVLPFWSYLKLAQEQSGDAEGARESQRKVDELEAKWPQGEGQKTAPQ